MPKVSALEKVGNVAACQSHPSGYASLLSSYPTPSPDRVARHALQQLEAARQKDIEAHERNLPLIEENKAVHAAVAALMAEVCMPAKWTERDTSSRSRYPKTVTHAAGWQTDLTREARIDDGFAYATSTYESLKARYQAYAEQAEQEAAKARAAKEREAAAEIEKRRADMAMASILLRYSLPIESTWSDVLDALCAKDQRLALAVAMEQTRGDWSDGPYRVRDALGDFKIETTEDKDIANCILECLEDFSDGRVFRDCAWNYGRLFGEADDQQLVADIRQALSNNRD